MSTTKSDLLVRLARHGGFDREFECLVLNALHIPAERLRRRWGLWNAETRHWEAMPRPATDLADAVRLCERFGLAWEVSSMRSAGYLGSVDGKAGWSAQTPAAALTRALVAHLVSKGRCHE